jgi:hypothetical protein
VSSERWWWANKAQELRYHQLESARKQAESWRTGLAGLTALFAAVLVVKGRENVSALPTPFSFLVVALIGTGLAGWVWATLLALRAASGTPGDNCLLAGEDLQAWSRREVVSIQRNLVIARRLMLSGVVLIAAAIGVAWLTPVRSAPGSVSVIVDFGGGTVCGTLTGIGDGAVVVQHDGHYRVVPLSSTVELRSTDRCS